MQTKAETVERWLAGYDNRNQLVVDLGANTGRFSDLAARLGYPVVAHDIDANAVQSHFCRLQAQADEPGRTLPLLLDLTNPAPALGWHHKERDSFIERNAGSLVMALALVHHLAIGNNVPLAKLAEFFADIASDLIVEFVPKSDSQVKKMLATREDVFPDYHVDGFEAAFAGRFSIR